MVPMVSSRPSAEASAAPTKSRRVRTGCLTCRERHLKCDEGIPDCLNCRKSNRNCKRGVRLNFLDVTVHEPTFVPISTEWVVQFQDESRDIASEYRGGLLRYAPYDPEPANPAAQGPGSLPWPMAARANLEMSNETEIELGFGLHEVRETDTANTTPASLTAMSPYSTSHPLLQSEAYASPDQLLFSRSPLGPPFATMPRPLRRHTTHPMVSLHEQLLAVKEQSALQQRRKSDASSVASIVPQATNAPPGLRDIVDERLSLDGSTLPLSERARNGERDYLSSPEEIYYLQIFIEKVGIWMDSFDKDKHFSRLIPYHALKSTMLLNAFLACGVKHLSLFSSDKEDKALFYYNTATTQLLRSLQNPDRNTAECATAAVVLNVYEIMSEKPAQRMNHIAGARALIRECGWDARSTGIGSACFWLNISMEVLSCLSMDWQTAWDPEHWGLDMDFSDDDDDIGIGNEEIWVHRIFYIIAKATNFRATVPDNQNTTTTPVDHARLSSRVAKWQELKALCDRWNNVCPRTMHPLGYLRPSRTQPKSAFPHVWMIIRAAIVGRLFYHTAQCILAQTHPLESNKISPEMRSMQLHHAHQVCGIVAHTDDRGIATVAIRCLAIAAAVLDEPREQEEVLTILERINSQSGWRLGAIEAELKRAWGWGRVRLPLPLPKSPGPMGQFLSSSQMMGPPLPPPGVPARTQASMAGFTSRTSTPPIVSAGPLKAPLNPLSFADFSRPNHPYQNWYEPPNPTNAFGQRLA